MSHLIAPSLLASDFANLQKECEMLNNSEADWYHLDVMDGVFVPNISFGIPVIDFINKHTLKPVHIEASTHLHRTLQAIKQEGMKAGVALNPHTNVEQLEPTLEEIDLVCLMSVNPGFGGQAFIEGTYRKVEKLKSMIAKAGLETKIEIDGGVTSANAKQLIDAGADVLVAGSFVFKAKNPTQTIADLKNI